MGVVILIYYVTLLFENTTWMTHLIIVEELSFRRWRQEKNRSEKYDVVEKCT
jgi:hypothetical protein